MSDTSRATDAYRALLAPSVKRREDLLSGEDVLPGLEIVVGAIFED